MNPADSLFIDAMNLKASRKKEPSIDEMRSELEKLDIAISKLSEDLREAIMQRDHLAGMLAKIRETKSIPPIKLHHPEIEPGSPSMTKAAFMLKLFNPRQDIFATRERSKNGNTVYYPKCENLWMEGCYRKYPDKRQLPCSECPLNHRMPLSPEIIIKGNFLNSDEYGRGAIGIYPLKPGNTTRFVAIDLDESDWQEASESILITARNIGIAMAIERSCGGDGAHLWIFFNEDIPAAKARRLAMLIIDRARETNCSVSMKSYDRLFPSQDRLSEKGFGNLILLPLVASAVSRGCTLFLDDDFQPYPLKEQITYLSSLTRHSIADVNAFIEALSPDDFKLEGVSAEQLNPSWSRWIPRISKEDVTEPLIIYRSTGISFDKQALSSKAQEALRRIATIPNTGYYKELAKRDGSIANVYSRIPLFEENERVLKLPRGFHDAAIQLFTAAHIPFSEEDHRTSGTCLETDFNKELWPYQQEAVELTRHSDCGIIASATGSGKTVIAMAIIAEKKERTLIIVNSKALLEQWRSAIADNLTIKTESQPIGRKARKGAAISPIGTLDGQKGNRLKGVIDIAMLPSLLSQLDKDGSSIASMYGLIIVDECHHIAAEKFRNVLGYMNARYVYGLSATPKRDDGLERIVYSECGNVIFTYEASKLAYSKGIAQYFKLRFLHTAPSLEDSHGSFTELLNRISDDVERNRIIVDDICEAYGKGRNIIILTRRISQNNAIGKLLTERDIPHIILSNLMKQREIKDILSGLRASEARTVLIATDKLLGEGIDIPYLDTLFLASPFMQESAIQQYAGRISRDAAGKGNTLIYDYADFMIPRLNYMYARRLTVYRKLGYVPLDDIAIPSAELLFDDRTFLTAFIDDIENAAKEIIISCSFIVQSAVTNRILDALAAKSVMGIRISIYHDAKASRLPSFHKFCARLSEAGIAVAASVSARNSAIFDSTICWYGDFSLLGQSAKTQQGPDRRSMLRIVNQEVASAFLEDMLEIQDT